MKLIIQPADGVAPILAAIKSARKTVEIAIFRFDRADVEQALMAAAERGVRVTALIAYANRGGEQNLRKLELRFLAAGIIVARTADDLVRYHNKYLLIDRRTLYMLSFNFTRLDIDHSRGFGLVTTRLEHVKEAARLFKADCTRVRYTPKVDSFVVSPANSRLALGTFLKHAKTQLLIYDPKIADKEMLHILRDRARAGVVIKLIGQTAGKPPFEAKKLPGMRLHTRTIVRDRRQMFIGSQSLRTAELDARRELGLIVQDAFAVKKVTDMFEADWKRTSKKTIQDRPDVADVPLDGPDAPPPAAVKKAVAVFTKELEPLADAVKKAVKKAVVKAGDDVLEDKDVKATMKKVVKGAVKSAVKDAVRAAKSAGPSKSAA
jgi:cardiolipin synthase